MASLSTKISQYVGSKVDFKTDVILKDDGDGVVYIAEWNLDIAKPTSEQLEQYNDIADLNDAMAELREKRNQLLSSTDWIVTKAKETGTTIPTAWKTYRQALRDITQGLTTVEEVELVIFPEKP